MDITVEDYAVDITVEDYAVDKAIAREQPHKYMDLPKADNTGHLYSDIAQSC